jgi:excisionase family DNA binding protein
VSDQLLTRQQAAEYLQVSVSYLNRGAVDGSGPRMVKLGHKTVRYKRAELDKWIERNSVGKK